MRSKVIEGIFITVIGGMILLAIEYYILAPNRKNIDTSDQNYHNPTNDIDSKNQMRTERPLSQVSNKEHRHSQLQAVINKNVDFSTDKDNMIISIKSDDQYSSLKIESYLANILRSNRFNIILNYFKDSFKETGFWDEAFTGNSETIQELTASGAIDYFVLGVFKYSLRRDTEAFRDILSCDVELTYIVVNKSGNIIESKFISAIGAGFNKNSALDHGIEKLIENNSSVILKSIN